MAGFLAVDSETGSAPGQVREGYGKLRLLALPPSTTVPGPGQVQNKYDSDEKIATQLNLLNQADSTVIRGRTFDPAGRWRPALRPARLRAAPARPPTRCSDRS